MSYPEWLKTFVSIPRVNQYPVITVADAPGMSVTEIVGLGRAGDEVREDFKTWGIAHTWQRDSLLVCSVALTQGCKTFVSRL